MDPWAELLDALQQLASHDDHDVARRARRALVCYNRCVIQAEIGSGDDEDIEDLEDDEDDLFRDY